MARRNRMSASARSLASSSPRVEVAHVARRCTSVCAVLAERDIFPLGTRTAQVMPALAAYAAALAAFPVDARTTAFAPSSTALLIATSSRGP